MNQKTLSIAYCPSNQSVADSITRDLQRVNYTIKRVPCTDSDGLYPLLQDEQQPVLLIISDNFLKSTHCMHRALQLLRLLGEQKKFLPIITDGQYVAEGVQQKVPTVFERVSNVIRYMNHWQNAYLAIRSEKKERNESESIIFENELKRVRTISSEIGEFLRYLRNTNYVTFEHLHAQHYESVFRLLNDQTAFYEYKQLGNAAISAEETMTTVATTSAAEQQPTNNATADRPVTATTPSTSNGTIDAFQEGMIHADEVTEVMDASESSIDLSSMPGTSQIIEQTAADSATDADSEVHLPATDSNTTVTEQAASELDNLLMDATTVQNSIPTNLEDVIDETIQEETELPTTESTNLATLLDEPTETTPDISSSTTIESLLSEVSSSTPTAPTSTSDYLSETVEEIIAPTLDSNTKIPESNGIVTDTQSDTTEVAEEITDAPLSESNGIVTDTQSDATEVAKEITDAPLSESNDVVTDTQSDATEIVKEVADAPLSEPNDVVTDTQSDATEVAEEITNAPLSEPNDVVTTATASIELVTDTIEAEIFSESEKNIQQLATTVALIDPTEATSRAQAYFVNGQIAEGLQMYQQAVEQHPDHTDLRYQYAVALLKQQNDFTAAKQQLEQLLTVDASNSAAYFKLAELAEMDSDMAMAKTHYEQVAALAPDYPQLDYRLGMVHLAQSNPQHLKAAQYFKQAIQKQSQMADAYYQLALLLKEHAQKPEKAVKFLQKTLQVNPEHAYAAYDLARLQHELGNTTEAAAAYAKAIVIDPDLRTSEQDQLYFSIAPTVDPQVLQDAQDEIAQLHALLTASEATIAEREAAILQRDATIAERDADVAERDNLIANKETTIAEQLAHINVLEKPAHPIKTVMITGATSGIGRATAELFAREGHRLILTGRRVERLRELEADFKNEYQHSQVQLLPFDVRDTQAIEEAMTQLTEEWQAIDILVNNAGLASGLAPIHEGELADWERMIDTNIKGLLYMTRAITPQMVARRQGHVINVGSIAGKQAYPNGNVYNATKFAVDGLTQAMRLDLYPYNVRVSQVAPGHVEETEFALVRFHGNEERAKIYEDFQPLKASDVAETIYFIATRPSHVNIQDVLLMGTQQGGATFIDRSGRNTPQE